MKRIIYITILLLAFSFVISAQNCPKFKLEAPESVPEGETVTVVAKFEKSDDYKSLLKWTIINGNQVTRKISAYQLLLIPEK